MATARASELPVLIVNGADSPRSRIGRGLESIGGMTAETLQRISTAVGGVVKSPVVLMAKVGGLASPRAATLTAPPGSSLAERVYHLENQMKSLEEKISPMTVVTELDPSTRSEKEKPRIAKSLLQEMEADRTLEKRVQMLEDLVNERMERFEKALSSIQSRLDHVEFCWRENVAGDERQESLSGEPQYYDAEQLSDNFEALETSSAAPTTAEHVEPLQDIDAGNDDDFLDPQLVSTPVYSKEAFLTQPMKSAAPSSEPSESVRRNDTGNLDRQLASTLEELHGSFVTESSAAAASAKFLEIARAVTAEKSTLAQTSSEPQSASVLEEPREAFLEEASAVVLVAKSAEHAQEDAADKSGTTIAAAESPSPPTFEATQKDFTKEPLAVAPNTKLAQELATQGVVIIALAPSEPPVTSKSVEEPSVAVPSANSEESAQEDTGYKSVTVTAAGESPKAFAFQDPQEDFVKESLAGAPGAGPAHEPSSQEDSSTTSDMALASSESPAASKSVEEPSAAAPGTNFEGPAEEDAAGKSGSTIAAADLPLAASLEEPREESVKEFTAAAPSAESSQVLATQEDDDIQVAAPESQMASEFVEEPSAAALSADSEEPAQEDVADKTGTKMAATESSLASSLEEPKGGFEKDSMAYAPSGEPAQDHSDMAAVSSETEGASKFVVDASSAAPSANFGEREHKADAEESGTISAGAESPSASSFDDPQADFEKESSAAAPSAEPAQLATQEDSSMALAAPETTVKSKFSEDPSAAAPSTNFGEREHKADAEESGTISAGVESPSPTSFDDPQADFEKESSVAAPSAEPAQLATQEDSSMALVAPETTVKSKFAEEPSAAVSSANFEEPAHEDEVDKSDTVSADVKSPRTSSFEEPLENFEKDSLATALSAEPSHEPSSQEDSGATSDKALASSESPVASKSLEEPLATDVPSAKLEEPAHEDEVDKSVDITAAADSPLASSFEEPHEDFEESLVAAPSAEPSHEPASQEDSGATSDKALASSESPVASESLEVPSATDVPSAKLEEPAHEDEVDKSDTVIADVKSPRTSSFEEPQEGFEKDSLAAALSAEPSHEPSSQEDSGATSDKALASSESPVASESLEEPPSAVPSAKLEEPAHEDEVDKSDTVIADVKSPRTSSFEEPQEDFEESLVASRSAEPSHEPSLQADSGAISDKALASSESPVASESLEEPPSAVPSANFEEPARDEEADKSVAITAAADSPLASSFEEPQENFEKDSLATAPSAEPSHEPSSQEEFGATSDKALASSESPVASESLEEPLATDVPSAKLEEPAHEDEVDKSDTVSADVKSPRTSSFEEPQEGFEKDSLAAALSAEPSHEPSSQEDSGATSDKALASSESPVASESLEEPLATDVPSAKLEEPAHEDEVDKSDTVSADVKSPRTSSFEEPLENFEKDSLATALSAEPSHEPSSQEDSGATSDKALASSESPVASESLEVPSATDVPSAKLEEPAHEDEVDKSDTVIADVKSPRTSSFEEPQEGFEKDSLAAALSAEPSHEPSSQEDSGATSDKALASSESPVASESLEEPLATDVPSAKFEEPAHEDEVDKSVDITAAADSPLASSFEEPQENFEKDSLATAPSAEPSHEPSSQEESGAISDKALASSESPVASESLEMPSATDVPSAKLEEPAHEDEVDKSDTVIADVKSPQASSFEEPQEGFEKESRAAVPDTEPAQELATQKESDIAPASFESKGASKFVEEPSAAVASAGFEEPAHEDAADKSVIMTAARKDPQEDSVKESLAAPPNAGPAHELSSEEDLDATSDMAFASSAPHLESKFVEKPSPAIPSANSEEPAQNDAIKSDTISAGADSPLASSFEKPQKDFEKESLAATSSREPAQGLATEEDSHMAPTSSESQEASESVEEPSAAVPSADFEEPTHEDAVDKSVAVTAAGASPFASSFEGPQEDSEKESIAAATSAEPARELATQEDSDMAPSEPQVASKFAEEPSATDVPSAKFEEPAHEDEVDKSDTLIADVKSPLASSFEEPHEDFEKESLAAAPSAGPNHELSSQEESGATSDKALASSESPVASKFVEEPPSAVPPSAKFEEPAHEDEVDKSGIVIADVKSPRTSSFEEPQEDFEKESLAAAPSAGPNHEPSSQEESGATSDKALASSESPVASESLEEPPSAVPSANFEEPARDEEVDKSDTVIADVKSPRASSFEEPQEDFEKDSLATAPSAEPSHEPSSQEDSGATSDKALASSESPAASKFVEESPSAVPSASSKGPARDEEVDKSDTVIADVKSPLASSFEEPQEDFEKESLAAGASAEVLEPTEEDESGKSPIAFAPLEAPSASFFGIPQEPSGTSVQSEERAQEKSGNVLPGAESTLTSTVEEGNHAAKESEYKLAEDFKVHHEHIKSAEKDFPRSQSNLAHVSSDESLAAEDCDDHLESDQSGEEFFDAEYSSGNFESWESDEPKSFEDFGVDPNEPGEATGINAAGQKETLVPASSVKPAQEPEQARARELAQEPEQTSVREFEQEPDQASARDIEQDHESAEQARAQEHEQKPEQEPEQRPAQEHEQETGQERGQATAQAPGQEHEQKPAQEPEQEPTQEPAQELGHKPEQQSEQQSAQEPEQEDLTRNSAMALPSEPLVTSKSGESLELLAEEPLAAVPSTKLEEPPHANTADESGTRDLPLTSTAEEPQIDTVVPPEKSLSTASFHQSGNPELLENLEQTSSETPGTSSTPQEVLEREPLTAAPNTEIAQGYDAGESDNVHTSLEPKLEESKEALANEPVKAVPSSESTEPDQEVGDGQSGAILASSEPQLTPTSEEPQEGFVKEPLADAQSASKSVDLEESLADEPSAVTTSAKLAPESVADKISAGIVEESPLTPIAEEPQNGSLSSLGEGKHGLDEADQKFLEDVKIIAEPIEETIPRTQSDLTHVKLNPEAAEDATKLQSQGSFLAFGATSVDSKEALVKETLPSSKLLELFEEENNSGKRGPVLADSPMTSTVEEPQKPLAEEPTLASAKSVPKGHGRWRGFARSSSEPQFAFKLEEHRKALAKESSVAAAVPSASKLGEEHAQEDFGDAQCLPFRILGEGKPPRKESEFKLVQDVKSPATKSETASSPYVLEPKPSKMKEIKEKMKKEKKEKKERKLDAAAVEKERRLSLRSGEMERKSSLRAEEKDSKYSPRTEEKHRQPFRHLRDRLRHAFSVNKEL